MQLSSAQKENIAKAIEADLKMRQGQESGYKQANHAQYLDIHPASYSRIMKGEHDKVLSDLEWVRVGKKLFVDLSETGWKTAKTAVYDFVTGQLAACQQDSLSAINCDLVGIGKTHAAEIYAAKHPNVIYIKCRQGITRADLMRQMARNMGLENKDKVAAIRERVELHLWKVDKPIVVLDDAGYLNDNCWMEIKGLYDVSESACGWYVIGDTSLEKKINKMLAKDKVGWDALFDRFNRKYQAVTELYVDDASVSVMRKQMASQILKLNMPDATDEQRKKIMAAAGLSLRALRKEIAKWKRMGVAKAA